MKNKLEAMKKICNNLELNAKPIHQWDCKFHLAPKTGWLNDPNGLCQFKGLYHIFFQYSPFDTKPGINYWGHYSTKDFINYTYHVPALYVDENFDCHGVYSGSALIENNTMNLFYTGNVKQCGDFDYTYKGREQNTIKITSNDAFNFSQKKLLMTNENYPKDCSCHVRDPKVWKENNIYYMVLGSRTINDIGEVLLYSSKNLDDWQLINRISTKEKFGYMWECPDMFKINDTQILAISPQGIKPNGFKYNNIYQSGYFTINGDFTKDYELSEFTEYDCGFDFYAPQSFIDEKGRRILIAWFGLPDLDGLYSNPPDKECGRVHILTTPRELSINENGKLCQYPIREINSLKLDENQLEVHNNVKIPNLTTFSADINTHQCENFLITIREDCNIKYKDETFTLSFGKSGMGRTERSATIKNIDSIYILCDTSCIEIFINHGEYVFSSRFYPNNTMQGLTVQEISGKININYSNLKGFNITNEMEENQ